MHAINEENLKQALSSMLGTTITRADYQTKQLHGGTLGDVKLVTGVAETADARKLPYKIVLKVQKKWERYRDPDSWRREYDLYQSDFGALFCDSFRWAICYHAAINEAKDETQIWMEYMDGVSGLDLTGDQLARAAEALGRLQGKLYAEKPALLDTLSNLSQVDFMKNFYLHYRSWNEVYDYIRSDTCEIPKHLCKMLIDVDENESEIYNRIEKLPIVLCHRDFWVTNILCEKDQTVLIDWDTSGWGYWGEDIASLIADEADIENMVANYQRCVLAYDKGFSAYAKVSHRKDHCVRECMLLLFGYRLVEWYKFAVSADEKEKHLNTLQKIYEMEDLQF